MPSDESMITRHGRSASTVSTVRPNSDEPARRSGSGMTMAAAWISSASLTIRRPAPPARTFSTWPVTRRPPRTRAWSTASWALDSASGMEASIGALAGTVTVTSTWMPRRRRAARRTAMAMASPEYWPSSKATRIDSYSTSCSTIGSGIDHLRGLGQAQALVAPVEHVAGHAERPARSVPETSTSMLSTDSTTNAMPVPSPADEREQRELGAPDADVARDPVGALDVGLLSRAAWPPTAWAMVNESIAPKA